MTIKIKRVEDEPKTPTKKSITFYAAADVAEWIGGLDAGEVSRHINDAIREGALKPKPKGLFQIPLSFWQMSSLLAILKEVAKDRQKNADDAGPEETTDEGEEWVREPSGLLAHFMQFVKE